MPPTASKRTQQKKARSSLYGPLADLDELTSARKRLISLIRRHHLAKLDFSERVDVSIQLDGSFQPAVKELADEVVASIGVRPSKNTLAQIQKCIRILAGNLANALLRDPELFVGISLGPQYFKSSRYNPHLAFGAFTRVVFHFRDRTPSLIDFVLGRRFPDGSFARSSRIRATNDFVRFFCGPRSIGEIAYKNTFSTFSIIDAEDFEPIRLKEPKKRGVKTRKLIEYDDTPEIAGMRERLSAYNSFLRNHWIDIKVTDAQCKTLFKKVEEWEHIADELDDREQLRSGLIDWRDHKLYRVFNGEFSRGGRFYGGWWQLVPSARRKHITINGYRTAELDFRHMQPAMLYAMVGEPLNGYAYEIDGIPKTDKNKEAIKTTFFKLIYSEEGQTPAPLTKEQMVDLPGWTWEQLLQAVKERHAPIDEFFASGKATELQRVDSDIAEQVMLGMMERNILVLPIHDSFIVRADSALLLQEQMETAYERRFGNKLDIKTVLSSRGGGPDGQILSTFEEFREVLRGQSDDEKYQFAGYYRRRRDFVASLGGDYFSKFEFL